MPPAGSKGLKRTVRDAYAREKELAAWRLFRDGVTLELIAATPGPWGDRMYADSSGACKAVGRVRGRMMVEAAQTVEEWRHVHRERLGDLWRRSVEVMDHEHPIVGRDGDVVGFDDGQVLTAIRAGNGVLDSLATLDGLNAAAKFESSGPGGAPIEVRIGELVAKLPRPGALPPAAISMPGGDSAG